MGQEGSCLGWAELRALLGPAEGKAAPAVLSWSAGDSWAIPQVNLCVFILGKKNGPFLLPPE